MKRILPFLFVLLCLALFGVAQEPIPNFPAAGGRTGQVPYAGVNGATWRYLTGSGNLFTNLYASALIVRNADTNAVLEWIILTNSAAKQIDFMAKDGEVLGRINENGFVGGGSQLAAVNAATVTVIDGTDATSFVGIFDSATGSLPIKTDAGLAYNASTATLTIGAGGLTTAGPVNAGSMSTEGNMSADGFFIGDGSQLTALNADALASGTVPDARYGGTIELTNNSLPYIGFEDTGDSQYGTISFSGASDRFEFSKPISGDGSGLTALSATELSSGTVPDARLSGAYNTAQILSTNILYRTNAAATTIVLNNNYQLYSTNNNIVIGGVANVSSTETRWAVVNITNSSGATVSLALPASWRTGDGLRTYYVTNGSVSILSVNAYANLMTNCIVRPLW